MFDYLFKRGFQSLSTVVAASLIIFFVIRLVPGDPAMMFAGGDATPETIAAIREELGLNLPAWQQYLHWIGNMFSGDFGVSYFARVPVLTLIGQRLLPTFLLLAGAVTIMTLGGFAMGVIAAVTRNRSLDAVLTATAAFLSGAPVFWTGLLAILFFSVYNRWLPVGGYINPFQNPVQGLQTMVLPCAVLGIAMAGTLARFIRTSYKEALNSDYIRLAYAKGATRRRVIWHHATRNALVPVVTVFGIAIATLLGGSVVIETVFSWPGLGLLMIGSINVNDYPTVQTILLFYVVVFVVINFLVDVSYSLIDPRIRLSGGHK
jgi:ABC-type dipeptide/oligopeptide/nickel transport system permease component